MLVFFNSFKIIHLSRRAGQVKVRFIMPDTPPPPPTTPQPHPPKKEGGSNIITDIDSFEQTDFVSSLLEWGWLSVSSLFCGKKRHNEWINVLIDTSVRRKQQPHPPPPNPWAKGGRERGREGGRGELAVPGPPTCAVLLDVGEAGWAEARQLREGGGEEGVVQGLLQREVGLRLDAGQCLFEPARHAGKGATGVREPAHGVVRGNLHARRPRV